MEGTAYGLLPPSFISCDTHTCLVSIEQLLLIELVKPVKDVMQGWGELPCRHIPQLLLFIKRSPLIYQLSWNEAVGGWQSKAIKAKARLM